jgi:sugar phosphate isomerase/epimerase
MPQHAANRITLFTKPWPDLPLPDLARLVKSMGFDGVELPVRSGYQVTPERIGTDLPKAVRIFADHGLVIGSVAGTTDEPTIAACGEAGVPIIRVCIGIDMKIGYLSSEQQVRSRYDALLPSLRAHGVTIGVQNHCDFCVGSAVGIVHLIERYDPLLVGAVLDQAHCAVDGEPEEMALDIVWPYLCMVNFKSASHRRTNLPDAEEAAWEVVWTTARHAGFSWRRLVRALKQRGYGRDICLPAEYTDEKKGGQLMGEAVVSLLSCDLAYLKRLLAEESAAAPAQAGSTDWRSTGRT